DDPHVLDFSNRGLKKLEKRDGVGVEKLSLDHNELTKLDNIDCFLDLQKLSATHNQITRMYSLARLSQLSSLDLSNNVLVCIEDVSPLDYYVCCVIERDQQTASQHQRVVKVCHSGCYDQHHQGPDDRGLRLF
ncbi:unnamed protein product, partial [Ixodes pacificus]